MNNLFDYQFIVVDYQLGEQSVVACYPTYREAELYVIHRTKEGSWASMEVEKLVSPPSEETEDSKALRLKMGWHCTAYYERQTKKLCFTYPQKVWAVVNKNCCRLPIEVLDDRTIRVTSFINPSHCVDILKKEVDNYLSP